MLCETRDARHITMRDLKDISPSTLQRCSPQNIIKIAQLDYWIRHTLDGTYKKMPILMNNTTRPFMQSSLISSNRREKEIMMTMNHSYLIIRWSEGSKTTKEPFRCSTIRDNGIFFMMASVEWMTSAPITSSYIGNGVNISAGRVGDEVAYEIEPVDYRSILPQAVRRIPLAETSSTECKSCEVLHSS